MCKRTFYYSKQNAAAAAPRVFFIERTHKKDAMGVDERVGERY
jgi:hypothetical protein